MDSLQRIEVPIRGMDCAECTAHVRHALAALPGVAHVDVFLASEKAVILLDSTQTNMLQIRQAVAEAGYSVDAPSPTDGSGRPEDQRRTGDAQHFSQRLGIALLLLFGTVLLVVIGGEWLGLFEALTMRIPWLVGAAMVLGAGLPLWRNVIRAAWRRQITSHTLMTLGVLAALAVGQWTTGLVVVFFMYVGDYVENFTTKRARRALRDLTALAPQTARVEREGQERELPIAQVRVGDTVIVRPGEKIPVDGEVIAGHATIHQAAITGEAMPVEAGPGTRVFAATIAQLGSLRVRATAVGSDTTFGHVIRLVEQAEAHRAKVQRFADRFSSYYLPIVLAFAALTFFVRRDPLATAAVLVVACSCSIALATPIAMLASIGAAARGGILIKGGKYLEALAQAEVLLIDKTGTVTLGEPRLTDVVSLNGMNEDELLALAASVERDSEHPLARAVCQAAQARHLPLQRVEQFEARPGLGVCGVVDGKRVQVGNARMIPVAAQLPQYAALEADGKTILVIAVQEQPAGLIAAADTLRPQVPRALQALRALGLKQIELLTGDNERAAAPLAQSLGIAYRANLLPEDKIRIVRDYQAQNRRVVMIGDGVNDAPALAQADVGIAMGAAGTDIAIEAAHIALMRDDWDMVPAAVLIARRTMGVVQMNLVFTAIYNLASLSLAALGVLPPMLAAAAQSLPDLGILANSSRLLRQK